MKLLLTITLTVLILSGLGIIFYGMVVGWRWTELVAIWCIPVFVVALVVISIVGAIWEGSREFVELLLERKKKPHSNPE